jgi:hypothetical protein
MLLTKFVPDTDISKNKYFFWSKEKSTKIVSSNLIFYGPINMINEIKGKNSKFSLSDEDFKNLKLAFELYCAENEYDVIEL